MIDGFCMKWSEDDIEGFHRMRETRNRVAHGKNVNLNVREVVEMNTQLRDIAQKIDQHLVQNFLISEQLR